MRRAYWALLVFALLFWPNEEAFAGKLKDAIEDLYGGDGITLGEPTVSPPPGVIPPAINLIPSIFTSATSTALQELSSSINEATRLPSLSTTVGAFTYEFDPTVDVPVRTTESFGPILAERARTKGKGKLTLGFSYTRIDFDEFDGKDLNNISLISPHPDVPGIDESFENDFIKTRINIDITEDIFALSATYGITDKLDIGILVPMINIDLDVKADSEFIDTDPNDGVERRFADDPQGDEDSKKSHTGGEESGLGDILIRGKYNFWNTRFADMAGVLEVKTKSGKEDDLLGTGHTDVKVMFVLSKSFGPFSPHINIGHEWNGSHASMDELEYALGFDYQVIKDKLTVAVDVIGSSEYDGDNTSDEIADGAIGFKWRPYGDLIAFGALQFPLNKNEGLRADFIPMAGLEFNF